MGYLACSERGGVLFERLFFSLHLFHQTQCASLYERCHGNYERTAMINSNFSVGKRHVVSMSFYMSIKDTCKHDQCNA